MALVNHHGRQLGERVKAEHLRPEIIVQNIHILKHQGFQLK
jgi:hypothetical protein